jgi:lipoprotein-anchoring transpeptidase ErfK/SrfK
VRSVTALVLAATIALLVGGCAGEPAGDGFTLSAEQLSRRPEGPSPWEVQVARVRPDLPAVTVSHRPPPEHDATAPSVAQASVESALTPIPSTSLSWGSAEIEGGWSFTNPTVIGSPLVFLVVEDHGDWLEVMTPTRPNQQVGWLPADQVTLSTHEWRIEIDVTRNRLRIWDGPDLRIETSTVDGKPATPTPLGRYYVNETQAQSPTGVYGSWIISTNGFSDSLERFSGEVPIFAVHGTNRPETMGQDISNGCVRVPNDIVDFIADNVPAGTPLDVVA